MLTAWCSFGNAPFLTKLCPALNSFSGFGLSIVHQNERRALRPFDDPDIHIHNRPDCLAELTGPPD